MNRPLRRSASATSAAPTRGAMPTAGDPPPARRFRPPGLRDPRLLLGVALVAVSIIAGGWLLGDAERTEPMWSVTRDLPAGSVLDPTALRAVPVRLGRDLRVGYLPASEALSPTARLSHGVAAGELLSRSALADDAATALVEVPIAALAEDVPDAVTAGALVDVWVAPGDGAAAIRVLADVEVLSIADPVTGLAPQTLRRLVVGLAVDEAGVLPDALAALAEGRITIVSRRGQ